MQHRCVIMRMAWLPRACPVTGFEPVGSDRQKAHMAAVGPPRPTCGFHQVAQCACAACNIVIGILLWSCRATRSPLPGIHEERMAATELYLSASDIMTFCMKYLYCQRKGNEPKKRKGSMYYGTWLSQGHITAIRSIWKKVYGIGLVWQIIFVSDLLF